MLNGQPFVVYNKPTAGPKGKESGKNKPSQPLRALKLEFILGGIVMRTGNPFRTGSLKTPFQKHVRDIKERFKSINEKLLIISSIPIWR
jgi:hypothetical protein